MICFYMFTLFVPDEISFTTSKNNQKSTVSYPLKLYHYIGIKMALFSLLKIYRNSINYYSFNTYLKTNIIVISSFQKHHQVTSGHTHLSASPSWF